MTKDNQLQKRSWLSTDSFYSISVNCHDFLRKMVVVSNCLIQFEMQSCSSVKLIATQGQGYQTTLLFNSSLKVEEMSVFPGKRVGMDQKMNNSRLGPESDLVLQTPIYPSHMLVSIIIDGCGKMVIVTLFFLHLTF